MLVFREIVEHASATSLRRALLQGVGIGEADIEESNRQRRPPVASGWEAVKEALYPWLVAIDFADVREEDRDPDAEIVFMEPVSLRLMKSGKFQVQVLLGQVFFSSKPTSRSYLPILREWVIRRNARLVFLGFDEVDGLVAQIDIPSCKGMSVGSLRKLGLDFLSAVRLLETGHPDAELLLAALAAGEIDSLHQYENLWVEVKERDYPQSAKGKIEFGQDVTRFANAERGGILILGVGEKKDGRGSRIKKIHPIWKSVSEDKRRKILDSVVYPPIEGLRVRNLEIEDRRGTGTIVVIEVPPQREQLKPFLVHGVILGGEIEGSFIGIVRRRGEDSIVVNIAEIHSMITRGRAR
ncbi:helix-turn-helix domain-containing protein [Sinosporangium album]|uniref:AlbA family DNA-binding domain-containing protein n=1 Tax=Sinosporangium album TaxID=504805 RepID=UPI0015A2B642|nr:RNA-binding domain-containing protein [Sinosporangium album]